MTDTSLLRQPVEAALFLGQQFVEPGYNHDRARSYLPHPKYIVDLKYILYLAHIYGTRALATDAVPEAS